MSHSKGNKKNKDRCKAYKASGRRERNKVRRIIRHLKTHENDKSAIAAFNKLKQYA